MRKYIYSVLVFVLLVTVYLIQNAFFGEKQSLYTIYKYDKKYSFRYPDTVNLKVGDLIFRRMYDMDSTIALNFSQGEKRYSHAGILVNINNKKMVMHSIKGDEKNGVQLSSIKNFLSETKVWAIYRYPQVDNMDIGFKLLEYLDKNITFDDNFDLKSDSQMYCSEFVYKAIDNSLGKQVIKASKFFANKLYVTISDLYENEKCYLLQSSHKRIKDGEKQ